MTETRLFATCFILLDHRARQHKTIVEDQFISVYLFVYLINMKHKNLYHFSHDPFTGHTAYSDKILSQEFAKPALYAHFVRVEVCLPLFSTLRSIRRHADIAIFTK